MRNAFDLYVSEAGKLDDLKSKVEAMLNVELIGRNSDWSEDYYVTAVNQDWSIKLRINTEYCGPDTYSYEQEYNQEAVLLYVDNVLPEVAIEYKTKILESGLFQLAREEKL